MTTPQQPRYTPPTDRNELGLWFDVPDEAIPVPPVEVTAPAPPDVVEGGPL